MRMMSCNNEAEWIIMGDGGRKNTAACDVHLDDLILGTNESDYYPHPLKGARCRYVRPRFATLATPATVVDSIGTTGEKCS